MDVKKTINVVAKGEKVSGNKKITINRKKTAKLIDLNNLIFK